MAFADRVLAVKIVSDVSDINKGLKKTEGRLKGFAKSAGSWGKAISGALVLKGLEVLNDSVREGIKAFREEQDIVENFGLTIKNMGLNAAAAGRAMDEIAGIALDLGFDDAETIKGMDMFVKQTGNIADSTELMNLAMDIARSRNISLTDAMKIAQGVYNGSGKALKQYGIDGKKGMEAVAEARKVERGKARRWAEKHPMLVTVGKINDIVADIVGNFSEGKFGKAFDAIAALGTEIDNLLFGRKKSVDIGGGIVAEVRKGGLVQKLGSVADEIADSITTALGKVDWQKTLTDTLNSAMAAIKTGLENGTIGNLAAIGGAIAAAIFAFQLFSTAVTSLFQLPKWAAITAKNGVVHVLGAVMGRAMRVAMFVAEKFVAALGAIFEVGKWAVVTGAKGVIATVGALAGLAFRTAMFVADKFASSVMGMFRHPVFRADGKVAGVIRAVGRVMGKVLGLGLVAGIALGLAGIGSAIANKVTSEVEKNFGFAPGSIKANMPGNAMWGAFDLADIIGKMIGDAIGGNATGTKGAKRGLSWVGEGGPELVRFRGGERVFNNAESMGMSGGGNTYNINIAVPVTADEASIGKRIVRTIQQYERREGGSWRRN